MGRIEYHTKRCDTYQLQTCWKIISIWVDCCRTCSKGWKDLSSIRCKSVETYQCSTPKFRKKWSKCVSWIMHTDGLISQSDMSRRQYSLQLVIFMPYNLPLELCMEHKFLFMRILIPGPKHPKRSLDVFLEPLIHELKDLRSVGMNMYDCSTKTNLICHIIE